MTGLSIGEVMALPAVLDLRTACKVLGIGRTTGYALAQQGRFPCPVFPVGAQYRIPTAGVLELLGLSELAARSE